MLEGHSISVVLSTYNGSPYIEEQLESLRAQTLQPDEVLIADDCSTDATYEKVSRYIDKHALIGWKLSKNSSNLGWKRSFKKLILEAKGDMIFLCDQDDIWDKEKISVMARTMICHPNIDVLACLVDPLFEKGSQWVWTDPGDARMGRDAVLIRPMDHQFMYIARPGCSYCVRREFARAIDYFWKDSFPHDATLWRVATAKGSLGLMNVPLMQFRRHESNVSDLKTISKNERLAELKNNRDLAIGIKSFLAEFERDDELIDSYVIWVSSRMAFITGRNPAINMLNILRYKKFYPTLRCFLGDICCFFSDRDWKRI